MRCGTFLWMSLKCFTAIILLTLTLGSVGGAWNMLLSLFYRKDRMAQEVKEFEQQHTWTWVEPGTETGFTNRRLRLWHKSLLPSIGKNQMALVVVRKVWSFAPKEGLNVCWEEGAVDSSRMNRSCSINFCKQYAYVFHIFPTMWCHAGKCYRRNPGSVLLVTEGLLNTICWRKEGRKMGRKKER